MVGWLQTHQVRLVGGGHDFRLGLDSTADLVFLLQMWSHGADSARHSRNMLDAYAGLSRRRLHPCNQRAFGYAKSKADYDGAAHSCFIAHRTEAAVVREDFARVADGDTCKAVATDLARRGIPSVMGGIWNHSHIKAMVRRPLYLGKHLFDDVLDDARNVEPLVSASLWQEANAVLTRRGELSKNQRRRSMPGGGTAVGRGGRMSATALYDGLLTCATCGANLVIAQNREHILADGSATRYVAYRCRTSYHGQPGCSQPGIQERQITAYVIEHAEMIFGPNLAATRRHERDDRAEAIRARLVTVESMISRFNKVLLSEHEVDVDRLLTGAEPWFREEAQLRDELARLESGPAQSPATTASASLAQALQSRPRLKQLAQQCIEHLLVLDKAVVGHSLRRTSSVLDHQPGER